MYEIDQNEGLFAVFAFLGAFAGIVIVLYSALMILLIVSQWKIFSKAGQPGWACLIPFYNIYVYNKIIKRPGWWMLLYFLAIVPIIGLIAVVVIAVMDTQRLSKAFGKGIEYTIGLIFLGFIFYPLLAFGSAEYDASKLDTKEE